MCLVIGGVLLSVSLAMFIFLYRLGDSAWHLSIDPTNWWISRTVSQRVLGFRSPAAYKRTCVSYNIGPVVLSRFVEEHIQHPLGTNQLHVGDMLYDPTTKREIWRVLATERKHEFDDGTDRDGVLVRSSDNGAEAWLPREKLRKALVGR